MEKISISEAIPILKKSGHDIHSVTEWAEIMGYSRYQFSRLFREEYGIVPKRKLKVHRFRKIIKEIQKDPKAIGYKIARNTGFKDDKALHKYLSFHCHMTLNEVKKHVL